MKQILPYGWMFYLTFKHFRADADKAVPMLVRFTGASRRLDTRRLSHLLLAPHLRSLAPLGIIYEFLTTLDFLSAIPKFPRATPKKSKIWCGAEKSATPILKSSARPW